jgi:two-component system LytT family sensor kinase
MKKSIMYSLHGFIWICDLSVIFLATLAGGLWVNETILTNIAALSGIFIWSLALFYSGYSLFVPRLFTKQKYLAFTASLVGTSLIFPLIPNFNKVISAMSGNGWMGYSVSGYVQVVILCFIIVISGVILRVFIDWINDQQKKKELESEKLKSKLMVLINQNNPHFIFNVLNNIDSLITSKPAKASETIVKLSGLLRYIYANSDKDQVSLISEIEYVENYIELQALRLDSSIHVNLKKDIKKKGILVAPMLFLPFVENAFKHGEVNEHHPIEINISSDSRKIVFECRNHYNGSRIVNPESGFGLSNIIKRLDLMYPSQYTLNIDNGSEMYSVSLTLIIDED